MVGHLLVVTVLLLGPSDDDAAGQVSRLVQQLRDGKLEQRDAAEKALIALGPNVLDHLPLLEEDMPVGVQVRLGRVLKTLGSHIVDQTTPATRVSLAGEMGLAEALAALEKQTGNRVVGLRGQASRVKPQFVEASYWEALDQLLDQSGMTLNLYGGTDRALTVTARPDGYLPRCGRADYCGQFRVEATGVETIRDFRTPFNQRLVVRMEVAWEPQLTPLYLVQPLADVEARDEDGNILEILAPEGVRGARAHRHIPSADLSLAWLLPDRNVQQIASLKGTMTATLLGRTETFEFADLSFDTGDQGEQQQKRQAGVTVLLERVRKVEDMYEVCVSLRFDQATDALHSYRIWIANTEAFMVDAKGRQVDHFGCETTHEKATEIGLAYTFDQQHDPRACKFVIRVPTLIVDTPIEYELKSILLP